MSDPTTQISEWISIIWVTMLSLMAGLAAYLGKLRSGYSSQWVWIDFFADILYSALAGLMTWFITQAAGMDGWHSALLVAVSGHLGARVVMQIQHHLSNTFHIPLYRYPPHPPQDKPEDKDRA